ncbi:MAG: hypothetical protein HYX36_08480 [Rhizobiales bacterium]|nr:hypothetical protein [Hyphomicrobiales bacterium]
MRVLMIATLAALIAFSATAFASYHGGSGGGSSGGGGYGGGGNSSATHHCKYGKMWDKKHKKCVKASSGLIPDEERYGQGQAIAKAAN